MALKLIIFIAVGFKLLEKCFLFILESLPAPAQCLSTAMKVGFALYRLPLDFIFLIFKPHFALKEQSFEFEARTLTPDFYKMGLCFILWMDISEIYINEVPLRM